MPYAVRLNPLLDICKESKRVYAKYGEAYKNLEDDIDYLFVDIQQCDKFETIAEADEMRVLYCDDFLPFEIIVEVGKKSV